jgi:hypothetical protein
MFDTVEELRDAEVACLKKFWRRADQLRAAHPGASQQVLFSKACEAMPKTLEKYLYVRQRLQLFGLPALRLR